MIRSDSKTRSTAPFVTIPMVTTIVVILAFVAIGLSDASLLTKVNANTLCKGTMLDPLNLRCIYTGSKDGFDAGKFHAKVDLGLPSLIASVKSGSGLLGIVTRSNNRRLQSFGFSELK